MNSADSETNCKGCRASIRLAAGEVQRILTAVVAEGQATIIEDAAYERRLAVCSECDDLRYGTTCRYCGCLVAVRAKLAEKHCPASPAKW